LQSGDGSDAARSAVHDRSIQLEPPEAVGRRSPAGDIEARRLQRRDGSLNDVPGGGAACQLSFGSAERLGEMGLGAIIAPVRVHAGPAMNCYAPERFSRHDATSREAGNRERLEGLLGSKKMQMTMTDPVLQNEAQRLAAAKLDEIRTVLTSPGQSADEVLDRIAEIVGDRRRPQPVYQRPLG
jgi:hypothetical protein